MRPDRQFSKIKVLLLVMSHLKPSRLGSEPGFINDIKCPKKGERIQKRNWENKNLNDTQTKKDTGSEIGGRSG